MFLKQSLVSIYYFFVRKKEFKPKHGWINQYIKAVSKPPEVTAAFKKTEIRRKRSLFLFKILTTKWKIFIDGELMGYIGSGETKVIDKQGYIYVDVCNFYHDDGSLRKSTEKMFRKREFDLSASICSSLKSRYDMDYFECSMRRWKFWLIIFGSIPWENYGYLEWKVKEEEYILFPEDAYDRDTPNHKLQEANRRT